MTSAWAHRRLACCARRVGEWHPSVCVYITNAVNAAGRMNSASDEFVDECRRALIEGASSALGACAIERDRWRWARRGADDDLCVAFEDRVVRAPENA